ncbi:MAG: DUF1294 domain-containing protein [Promethearchaeota archaeon]
MQWQPEPVFTYTLLYALILNLAGFIAMWWDKKKARQGEWRVAEATLLILSFLGGAFGLVLGMYRFRHKTQKHLFQAAVFLSVIVTLVIYWYLSRWLYWILYFA